MVPKTHPDEVTELLVRLSGGSRDALDQLLPLVYDELRSLAAGYLRRERPDHTLQPTALVHEAWLKLIDDSQINPQNRAHFFGIAAQVMRRVLVDHARRQMADKRGGGIQKLSLNENPDAVQERAAELIALDDAMQELASFDPQKSRVVELRFFGGLSVEETARVLGVSAVTIKRQWRMAKAWLYGRVNQSQ
ncbi:MAG: sigma-70 family RNA polymerase sigma factor [Acidobacteriota bacterium]